MRVSRVCSAVVLAVLALHAARAVAQERAKAKSATTSPDEKNVRTTAAKDAEREALKREIARFGLVALVEATLRDDKPASASAWTPPRRAARASAKPGAADLWASTIDDAFDPGGLRLSSTGDDRGPAAGVPLDRIATVGHGEPLSARWRGHIPGTHVPGAPMPRGSSVASQLVPPETIERVVHDTFGRFRVCYESELRTNPGLQGRVVVKFKIAPSGAVSVASDGGSDLPSAGVVSCVVRGFAELTFPEFESGTVTVVYPLVFTPVAGAR